jgi:hypothetical protein
MQDTENKEQRAVMTIRVGQDLFEELREMYRYRLQVECPIRYKFNDLLTEALELAIRNKWEILKRNSDALQ